MRLVEAALFLAFLTDSLESVDAWVPTTTHSQWALLPQQTRRDNTSSRIHSSLAGGEGDDDECADEEECEIDWSQMPGMDDNGEAKQAETATSATASSLKMQESLDDDEDDDDILQQEAAKKQHADFKLKQMRLRLEMQWEMTETAEECDVQKPQTCGSDTCEACAGRGWNPCRFCRGTAVLYMQNAGGAFTACPVCRQGVESCKSCAGSGWIAGWTKLQLTEP